MSDNEEEREMLAELGSLYMNDTIRGGGQWWHEPDSDRLEPPPEDVAEPDMNDRIRQAAGYGTEQSVTDTDSSDGLSSTGVDLDDDSSRTAATVDMNEILRQAGVDDDLRRKHHLCVWWYTPKDPQGGVCPTNRTCNRTAGEECRNSDTASLSFPPTRYDPIPVR